NIDNNNNNNKNKYKKIINKNKNNKEENISCCNWIPTKINLPNNFKYPIKDLSLGKYHMVILDSLGKVYFCGTFEKESTNNEYITNKYQNNIICLDKICNLNNNKKNKVLPPIRSEERREGKDIRIRRY